MSEATETSEAGVRREKLDLIIRGLKRTRNKLGCGFVLILGIGIAMVLAGIFSEEAGTAIAIFGLACLLLAAVGAKIIWPNLNPMNSPLVKLLMEHPEKVAWIYSSVDPGSGGVWGRSHTINLNDTDKKAHSFIVKDKDLEKMMEILKSFAPRAVVGNTDEIRRKFARDPWSVMSDSETKDG